MELKSWKSIDCREVEAEELIETELAEGDNRLAFRGGKTAAAGDIDLPLPRILPPPSFLEDISQ